jgi:hypothetical protein
MKWNFLSNNGHRSSPYNFNHFWPFIPAPEWIAYQRGKSGNSFLARLFIIAVQVALQR